MSVGIVAPLNEQHLVLTCGQMSREQELGGINKYREKFRGKDVGTILWNFLGGDKCDDRSLIRRGKALINLSDAYFQKLSEL